MNQKSKHEAAKLVSETLPIKVGAYLRLAAMLDKYFLDPCKPSDNEMTLFELEFGDKAYNKALQYYIIKSIP